MKKFIIAIMFLAACGDDTKQEPLTCAEAGCPDAALCNRKGDCTCPQGSGEEPVACRFVPAGSAQ